MKTQKKLIVVLSIFLSIVILMGVLLQSTISKNVEQLLQKRIDANKEEVQKLFLLESSNTGNYVVENSFWDELNNAVNKKDTAWINFTMLPSISESRYKANFLWIVNYEGNTLTEKYIGVNPSADFKIQMPKNISFLDTLRSKIYLNEILKIGNTYTQISAAPIVQSNDHMKETKASGYLIVGKIIDSNYLKNISSLNSSFTYTLAKETVKEQINVNDAMITFNHRLKCMNAKDINIKINSNIPEVKVYDNFVKFSFAGYLFLITIAGIALFVFFRKQFFYPLQQVSEAFAKSSARPINSLTAKKTEFGDLARMMKSFFTQNDLLQTEIKQRKKSELELITALDEKEKSFTEKEKAKQSEAAKTEFLSTMSHEIRTPINGVIGIANLLKEEKLTDAQTEYVDALHFSANHLLHLVSDILDFSKIETGKLEFDIAAFDLNKMCESVYNLQKISAAEKNIKFNFSGDKTLANSILGDQVRLNQVLTNLLSNAIKFTESGTIDFGYKIITQSPKNCTIQFKITDTGIGIKDSEKENIFNGFSQANKNINRDFGGTGLGLTICKKLIELQGGKIMMESKYGVGTAFTFYLSFEKNEGAVPNNNLPLNCSSQNTISGMNVLVAEDNKINLLVLKKFLEKWGVNYKVGINGKEALELIEHENFDAVLMDLHMPEMGGEEATKIIRSNANLEKSTVPIIALTANASSETQKKLIVNGFSSYISKPFSPDNLFEVLKNHFAGAKNNNFV